MAQIDGKFLVNGHETADRVVNFLDESGGVLVCINFFDVASTTTRATGQIREYIFDRPQAILPSV
jgi:hypothetical protein